MYPLGLDISELSLKLIQFKKEFSFNKPKINLHTYNEIAVPEGYIENGIIKNSEGLVELIHKLIKTAHGHRITTREVVSVLPETKTFIKLIEIPFQKNNDLTQSINEELKHHLPFSPEEIYSDSQIIQKREGKIKILVGVAPKNIIESYTALLEKSNLLPKALEIEAAAIVRSLINEKTEAEKTLAIVDFGATRTSFIFYDQGTIQFTVSIPISGLGITKKIAETLKFTFEQAEKSKTTCGLDKQKCKGALREILYDAINNLISKIQESMAYYENHFPEAKKISKLIICGGGANFISLDKILAKELGVKIIKGNPWLNVQDKNNQKSFSISPTKSLSYATAIGLALRTYDYS